MVKKFSLVALCLFMAVLVVPIVSAQIVASSKILIIGDSHLAGPYGKQLYNLLVSAGHDVNSYGCVSARASHYVNGGFSCKKSSGSTINNIPKDYATQSINQLITNNDLDFVIISLGGNFIEYPRDPNEAKALIDKIKGTGKTCYWIGSPWGPFGDIKDPQKNEEVFKDFYIGLSEVNGGYCKIFDSLKYTNHDFCPSDDRRRFCSSDCPTIGTCKVHYDQYESGTEIANKWGEAVFQWLTSGSEPPVPDILIPPGSSPTQPLKGPTQASPLTSAQPSPASQKVEEQKVIVGCKSQKTCKEIDDVWGRVIGFFVRSNGEIWDTELKKWNNYESVWGVPKETPQTTAGETSLRTSSTGVLHLAMPGGDSYLRAFMRMITVYEGTSKEACSGVNPYQILKGGQVTENSKGSSRYGGPCGPYNYFKGYEGHPGIVVQWLPNVPCPDGCSTAAGRYQFMRDSWSSTFAKYAKSPADFNPVSQDLAVHGFLKQQGVDQLLHQAGSNPDPDSEDFKNIWQTIMENKGIGKQWASLPYACYSNQPCYGRDDKKFTESARMYVKLLQEELSANIKEETTPISTLPTSSSAPTVPGKKEISYMGNCPVEMAKITNFCIDKYENSLVNADGSSWSPYLRPTNQNLKAVSEASVVPQGYISGFEAAQACSNAGKRLCTESEWLRACQGEEKRKFPYGNEEMKGYCNYGKAHPPTQLFGDNPNTWNLYDPQLNQNYDLTKTGSYTECKTPEEVYDLTGNLQEWITDENGNPGKTFAGGFYGGGLDILNVNRGTGCGLQRTSHTAGTQNDYSVGFRCCADLGSSTTLTPSPAPTSPKTSSVTTDDFCAQIKQTPQEQFMRKNYLKAGTYNEFTKFRTETYGYFPGFGEKEWNPNPPGYYEEITTFMGIDVRLSKKIVSALKCVEKELKEKGKCDVCTNTQKYPNECDHNWKKYPYQPKFYSGFRGTNTYSAQSGEVSNHVYGIAIDIDPSFDSRVGNGCCGCGDQKYKDDPLCKNPELEPYERMIMPACWVEVFNEYGFYWLGDDMLQDNMHFEFLGNPTIIENVRV